MSIELPLANKKIKFHSEMFRTDGAPDNSLILEGESQHLNSLALEAYFKYMSGDAPGDILSKNQRIYIEKIHLPSCGDCQQKMESVRLKNLKPGELLFEEE